MLSVNNLPLILDKIKTAGTPPKFTHDFLKSSLGFGGSRDRAVIKVLRQLGFLNAGSEPTARYNEFRHASTSGRAIAAGLREGWATIFLADQEAHTRTQSQLKETFKNVTGKAEAVAEKMASTFRALAAKADFSAVAQIPTPPNVPPSSTSKAGDTPPAEAVVATELAPKPMRLGLGVGLHNDVHIHLPPTSDVAVYTAIFRAIREELLD
jgi:hypothetical protein